MNSFAIKLHFIVRCKFLVLVSYFVTPLTSTWKDKKRMINQNCWIGCFACGSNICLPKNFLCKYGLIVRLFKLIKASTNIDFCPNKIEMVQMEFFLTQLRIFLFTRKLFTLNAILLLIRNFSSTVMLLRV